MKLIPKSNLARQFMGAVIGAGIAYGAYASYQAAEPKVGAWVNTFWGNENIDARFSSGDVDIEDRMVERRERRNREIANRFAAEGQPGRQVLTPFKDIAEKAQQYKAKITPEQIEEAFVEEPAPSTEPVPAEEPETPAEVWQKELEQMPKEEFDSGEDLPDSGLGLSLVIGTSLVSAAVVRRRKK